MKWVSCAYYDAKKVYFMTKINLLLILMLINFLVQNYNLHKLCLCKFLSIKTWKNHPQKQDTLAKLNKFSILPWRPNLPQKNKSISFIWDFIILVIHKLLLIYIVQFLPLTSWLCLPFMFILLEPLRRSKGIYYLLSWNKKQYYSLFHQ